MAETLVISAYAKELVGLHSSAEELIEARVSAVAVGIGAIDAAAGVAAALAVDPPRRVILVGTCGEYAAGEARTGSLVIVERALWIEDAAGMEIPDVVRREVRGDADVCAWLEAATGAPRVTAACPAGITVDDEAASRIAAATGAAVEHMECFAVLRACERAGVPAAALLAVANRVGRGARDEWRRHRAEAEAAAVAAVRKALG